MSKPIHLLQWSGKEEPDEIEEIKELLTVYGYKVKALASGDRITSPDKNEFLNAMMKVLNSSNLQILYLSCHGNRDGISFSKNSPVSISFSELFTTMKRSERNPEKVITVILGFCQAMDNQLKIEAYAPEWIFELIGFKKSPTNLQVSDLGAGVFADILDFGKSLSAVIKSKWPKKVSIKEFPSTMKKISEEAHSKQDKNPGRFLRTNSDDVVCVVNYGSGKWRRQRLGSEN